MTSHVMILEVDGSVKDAESMGGLMFVVAGVLMEAE